MGCKPLINNNTKRKILDDILHSDELSSATTQKKLLIYLVECSLKNDPPSEYAIAGKVFSKDSSFNPNEDTIVRVGIYQLRKKLKAYYVNEGKKAKIRLDIPKGTSKGQYNIQFNYSSMEKIRGTLLSTKIILVSIIFILGMIILLLLQKNFSLKRQHLYPCSTTINSQIWSDFFKSEHSKLIILGNPFFYIEPLEEEARDRVCHDSYINNMTDVGRYYQLEEFKNKPYEPSFPYFNMAAVYPLPDILKLFHTSNTEFLIKHTSIVEATDLQNNDIIFIGPCNAFGPLELIFKDSYIRFEWVPENKLILQLDNDSTMTLIREGNPHANHDDLCVFRKLPGPKQNIICLIIGFHATASIGAAEMLTNEVTLKDIEQKFIEKYNHIPKYFDVIFRTTGINRRPLSTEIIYIAKIEPGMIHW